MTDTEADTGEMTAVSVTDYSELVKVQRALLSEVRSIRYRLGVIIVFFIVLPIVSAFIYYAVTAD